MIGPVNYFFLRRRRRLYLLLVTVPAGAGLVTLALFAYALVSDGLGVRVRVRSFTEIDQRAGHAVSWSRQSYYAGLAPSGGLKFPERAAVLPLDQYPAERRQGRLGTQQLVWSEGQNLVSGYIGARSTAQFLVVESGPSRRGLLVAAGQDAGDLQATNRLDAAIDKLIVKDDAGRVLQAKEWRSGNRAGWNPSILRQPSRNCRRCSVPTSPRIPWATIRATTAGWAFPAGTTGGWSNVDQNLPAPTFATGILERSIQATLRGDVQRWPPRSYVAITRTSPGVSLGYDRAREEASFPRGLRHLVISARSPTCPEASSKMRMILRTEPDDCLQPRPSNSAGCTATSAIRGRSTTCRSTCLGARCSATSAPTAPARRPACGFWPRWTCRPTATRWWTVFRSSTIRIACGIGWGSCPTPSAPIRASTATSTSTSSRGLTV